MLAPFLSIPVSLILVGGTVYCLAKALLGDSWVARLNYVLHALMALAMLGMVWHDLELPLLPQLLLFGTASFWFLLQAISRTDFAPVCHDRAGRLSCLYHAGMLAAMVFMLALPHCALLQRHSISPGQHNGPASHTGHAPLANLTFAPDHSALWTQPAAQVLTVFFAVAVLAWVLPIERMAAKLCLRKALPNMFRPSWHHHSLFTRLHEAGSALTMSLMFAAASLQI